MYNETCIPVRNEKTPLIEPQEEECTIAHWKLRCAAIITRVLFYSACVYFIISFSNIGSSKDEVMSSLNAGICREAPSIPFDGETEFFFDYHEYYGLSIKEKQQEGTVIPVASGQTTVIQDESSDQVYVKLDIKLSDEALQEYIWIDTIEENGVYSLIVNSAGNNVVIDGSCIQIDVIVTLPTLDAFSSFSLSLTNNNIHVESGFSFDDLSLSVANGDIDINEGISTGTTSLNVANGDIDANIQSLKNDLTVAVANGHIRVQVKDIDQDENDGIQIKSSIANGSNDIEVPTSFDSRFELKSFLGKKVIESSEPVKIHRGSSSWGSSTGYYGDDEETKNKVALSSANGNLFLTYA